MTRRNPARKQNVPSRATDLLLSANVGLGVDGLLALMAASSKAPKPARQITRAAGRPAKSARNPVR